MKSVWHELGIIEGKFRGVLPLTFVNTLLEFFVLFNNNGRKGSVFDYDISQNWQPRDFYGTDRSGSSRVEYLLKQCRPQNHAPWGAPIPEEVWNMERPTWGKVDFSEEELLGEEIIRHPAGYYPGYEEGKSTALTGWESQRYRLVHKMRYCIIPLTIYYKSQWESQWHYDYTGAYTYTRHLWPYHQRRFEIPEYWSAEGTVCKIGVFSEQIIPTVPLNSAFWVNGRTYTTPPLQADSSLWTGLSNTRIYGAADLSTHPDFEKYFDL